MNSIEIFNTIRDNASTIFQERIPEGTQDNILAVQQAMLDPDNAVVVNEFCNRLLNMVIKQDLISKFFSDPLKPLKRGEKPLGDTVEEIYVNFIKAKQYDPTGVELLNRKLPDVKTIFHRMNRQDMYKVTIGRQQLTKAFRSWGDLDGFIQNVINTLFNSSELDEFVLIKQLFKQAVDNNAMVVVDIEDPADSKANGEAFIKAVKKVSNQMVFPKSEFNAYMQVQDTDPNPIITMSNKDEQILIIDSDTDVDLAIDVLASTFNMSVSEFNDTRKVIIDAFPDPNMKCALVDQRFLQIYDDLVYFTDFENPEGLYRNYYLHVWQTLSYSVLVNAVCFRVKGGDTQDEGRDLDGDGSISPYLLEVQDPARVVNNLAYSKEIIEGANVVITGIATNEFNISGLKVLVNNVDITKETEAFVFSGDQNTGKFTLTINGDRVTGPIKVRFSEQV